LKRGIELFTGVVFLGALLFLSLENVFGAAFSLLPQNAILRIPRGSSVIYDQIYAINGGIAETMDIYFPPGRRALRRCVMFIHGGGWKFGDKFPCPHLYLLNAGYVVASINYRLSWQAKFPAQLQDVGDALKFLRIFAGPYGINPRQIAVMGESAGGHLAALLGVTGRGVTKPNMVIGICGPYNFLTEVEQAERSCCCRRNAHLPDSFETELLGFRPPERPEETKKACPSLLVEPGEPTGPVVLFQGETDQLVAPDQAREFRDRLGAAGKICFLITNLRDHAVLGPGSAELILAFLEALLPYGQAV
jgi:acetyl esterase/lipase